MDKKGVIFILFAHDCLLMKYVIAICGFSDLDCEGYVGKEKCVCGGEYVGDSPLIHKMPCHSLAKHVHLGRKQKQGKNMV